MPCYASLWAIFVQSLCHLCAIFGPSLRHLWTTPLRHFRAIFVPSLRQLCVIFAPSLRHLCTIFLASLCPFAPSLRHFCTISVPFLRHLLSHLCAIFAPSLWHLCAIFAPSLCHQPPPCGNITRLIACAPCHCIFLAHAKESIVNPGIGGDMEDGISWWCLCGSCGNYVALGFGGACNVLGTIVAYSRHSPLPTCPK